MVDNKKALVFIKNYSNEKQTSKSLLSKQTLIKLQKWVDSQEEPLEITKKEAK